MKKLTKLTLCALLSASMLAGCGSSASSAVSSVKESAAEETSVQENTAEETPVQEETTVTLTDHADREVTVPLNPQRVVVLDILPLASVLTVFLNSAETIIAMEPASMNAAKNGILSELFPEVLNATTEIMDGEDVNIESLLALQPDVVYFNAGNKAEAEKLDNAGLCAVGVSPTKWKYDCIKTYDEWISLLSKIYPGRQLVTDISGYSNQVYNTIQEKTKDIAEADRKKVLFLFQYDENTMITSGSSFFGQWWCDATGTLNAASGVTADNSNAAITMEQVYEWNPDIIVITNFTKTQPADLYENNIGGDDWSTVKAVQDKQVYKMPLGTYRTYTPGVDTPMTLEWLAQIAYPELFADIDLTADVREYYNTLYGIELTDEQINNMYHPDSAAGSWK